MRAVDMMWNVAAIEAVCVQLRKLTCDGSFVSGHTVNKEKSETNREAINEQLGYLKILAREAVENFSRN